MAFIVTELISEPSTSDTPSLGMTQITLNHMRLVTLILLSRVTLINLNDPSHTNNPRNRIESLTALFAYSLLYVALISMIIWCSFSGLQGVIKVINHNKLNVPHILS